MREAYVYPSPEEPIEEVTLAVALDDYRERRKKQMPVSQPLILKYRPISFEEVIGNKLAIQKLEEAIKSDTCPQAFLFSGDSGVGKTTLARIVATVLDASTEEIDAASNGGIENAKGIVEAARFSPILGKAKHLLIIDEAHQLTKGAQDALLKLIEEPPKYLSIALCTTDKQKLKPTIVNRCYHVPLKLLRTTEIEGLVADVAAIEQWTVNNDVFNAICTAATGSARKALSILQAGHSLQSREELSQVVAEVESEDDAIIQLCGYLIKGGRAWVQVSKYLERIEDYEEDLIKACRMLANSMSRSQEMQAKDVYRMLRAFTDTNFSWDKKVQLYSAVGKIMWGEIQF